MLTLAVLEITKIGKTLHGKTENTITLLEKIYNGKNSKSSSCEDLKDDIFENIESFRKKLDKYKRTKLKKVALKDVKNGLVKTSSYSTFKYWIIKDSNLQGIL